MVSQEKKTSQPLKHIFVQNAWIHLWPLEALFIIQVFTGDLCCFLTICCVYLRSIHCVSLQDCWRRPVSLFALLWFNPCSDSISLFHMPQQDNPPISHKMAASVIYNNAGRGTVNRGNGGSAEPCSQCVSQLEGVLSPHVKRLLAPRDHPPAGDWAGLQEAETDSTAWHCQNRKWKKRHYFSLIGHNIIAREVNQSTASRGQRSSTWPHCLTSF